MSYMKRKWIYSLLFILFLFTTIAFTIDVYSEPISRENAKITYVKNEEITNGIEMEHQTKEAKGFTSSTNIAKINIPAIDDRIFSWVQQKEDEFFNEIEAKKTQLTRHVQASFNVDTTVEHVNEHWLTIELDVQSFVDDSFTKDALIAQTETKTFTIDLEKEQIVSLNDIFPELANDAQKDKFSHFITHIKDQQIQSQLQPLKNRSLEQIDWILINNGIEILVNDETTNKISQRIIIDFEIVHQQLAKRYKQTFLPHIVKKEREKAEKLKEKEKKQREQKRKLVALTFDDGPDELVTPKILNILDKYKVQATFFMLSKSVRAYPKTAKLVAKNRHEIANHSHAHRNLNSLKTARLNEEINDSKPIITEITGKAPKLF